MINPPPPQSLSIPLSPSPPPPPQKKTRKILQESLVNHIIYNIYVIIKHPGYYQDAYSV